MAVLKKGLDYFPLSTEFDDRVKLIIGEFGMKGLGILIKLWQKVYNSEGYYCKWSKDVALLFSCECRESNSVVSEVLNCCLRREIFDKSLFEKYSILTSKGIQKRYFEACLRRKSVSVKSEYLLLSESELSDNVSILIPNESILNENAAALKQSKIKESKIKDNKGKDKPKNRFVPPTLNEVKEYCAERKSSIDFERFFNHYTANGWQMGSSHMKNWKAALCKWEKNNYSQSDKSGTISRRASYDLGEIKKNAELNTEIKY